MSEQIFAMFPLFVAGDLNGELAGEEFRSKKLKNACDWYKTGCSEIK
jgi:hypothetical protein